MRIHGDQLAIRILGTLTGAAFVAVGGYALFGADAAIAEPLRERASWFGITALIGGAWAIAVSWLDRDVSGVWCPPPRGGRRAGLHRD